MHRLLSTLERGFKEKIGWKRLGIAASLLIIAIAVSTLVRTLKGVDTAVILVALTEISPASHRARRAVRGRRVLHADLLRFLRAAHDRQAPCALPHRRAVEFHELHHRPQHRRHRLHRRRHPLPHLFGLRADRDRRRKDLLPLRADVLARQSVRARHRHDLASLGGDRHGPAADRDQPADRHRLPRRHRRLSGLAGHGRQAPRTRTERLEGHAAVGD